MTRQSGRQSEMNERFDHLEHMIDGLGRFMSSIANNEYRRINKLMFDFSRMNARIASISSLAESVKVAHDGVVAQRDTALAERDALKADDAADAAALATAEASLAAAEEMLKTLEAIVAGTPAGGQSTGGNTEGPIGDPPVPADPVVE